jgi:hypothetical protein
VSTPWLSINWTDPKAHVSPHFTVRECLWLKQWGRMAICADGLTDHVKEQLWRFCNGPLEAARAILGAPINVHCMFRPRAYNKLVGGAPDSAHICRLDWAACDFDVTGLPCDAARARLESHLERLGCRMERPRDPKAEWVHLDNREPFPGQPRYFPV